MPIYPGMHSTVDSPQLGKPEASGFNNFEDRSLKLAKTAEMVVKYQDSQGRARIKGGKGLKKLTSLSFQVLWHPQSLFVFQWFSKQKYKHVGAQTFGSVWTALVNPVLWGCDLFCFQTLWVDSVPPQFGINLNHEGAYFPSTPHHASSKVRSRCCKNKNNFPEAAQAASSPVPAASNQAGSLNLWVTTPRLNKFWIDQANLEPILTFLSKQWFLWTNKWNQIQFGWLWNNYSFSFCQDRTKGIVVCTKKKKECLFLKG